MIEVRVINKIPQKVEEYINKHGSTKTWLANRLNITKQTLNTILKSQNPTIETLIKMSVLLDCDITELYNAEIIIDGMITKIYRTKGEISLQAYKSKINQE